MSAIAFGVPMQFDKAYAEGISKLAQEGHPLRRGARLSHQASRHHAAHATHGIELRVHPTLVPSKRLIANVEGAMNAVLVKGDAVGATLYYGPARAAEPTASAVIADLVDVTRMHTADPEHRVPHLAFQPDQLSSPPFLPMGDVETSYYLRMRVDDKPGVLADIARILADREISIDAMIQKEPPEGEKQTDIILLTHYRVEAPSSMRSAGDRGAADGARHRSSASVSKAAGVNYVSTRGRMTARRPHCRFARSCSKALPPTAASRCRSTTRASTIRTRSSAARPSTIRSSRSRVLSHFIDDIPAADLRAV